MSTRTSVVAESTESETNIKFMLGGLLRKFDLRKMPLCLFVRDPSIYRSEKFQQGNYPVPATSLAEIFAESWTHTANRDTVRRDARRCDIFYPKIWIKEICKDLH